MQSSSRATQGAAVAAFLILVTSQCVLSQDAPARGVPTNPFIVQNPPTGSLHSADLPNSVDVNLLSENVETFEIESMVRNESVTLGAHSVLFTTVSSSFRRGRTEYSVGPFHATNVSSDKSSAQDDVIFNNEISSIIPPDAGGDPYPMYIQNMSVQFVTEQLAPWSDIPMWLREFTLVKVFDHVGRCRSSEFRVLNLEPYDDWTLRIKKPYGLMLHNPDAFPHRWALRIEIEDGRVPIGGVFSEGSFDFYLRVAYDWSEEPHLNAHKVSLDALGCPSALDKRHLLGL